MDRDFGRMGPWPRIPLRENECFERFGRQSEQIIYIMLLCCSALRGVFRTHHFVSTVQLPVSSPPQVQYQLLTPIFLVKELNFTCFPSSVSTDVFQNLSLGRPLPGIAVLKTCPSNGRKDYKGRNQSLGIASGWSGDRLMGGKMVVDPSR